MRNYSKIIGALAAASALAAGNASAIDLGYNLHAGYTSEYLFRGANLGTDLVEAGFTASADLAPGFNLAAGVWAGNFDAPANGSFGNSGENSNEIDLFAKASYDLGFATASVGYIYYYRDQDGTADFWNRGGRGVDDSQEVSFGLSRDLGFLTVSLTYFWDIVGDNDGYTELALSKSFELNSCLTLNTGVALGYLAEEGHLDHVTGKVSLDYEFVENAKLSPFVAVSADLSGGHGYTGGNEKNELVGGSMISVSF